MTEPTRPGRVVLLAKDGPSTRIVYHALRRRFSDMRVILEEPVPRSVLVRRRAKRLGARVVLGQLLFQALVVPALRRRSAARIAAILREHGLSDAPIDETVLRVDSVNSDEARAALRELAPRVVVVNGTRIIGAATLAAVDAPFLNMHAGITPLYRGVHGGYWALAEGRDDLVGTTVHLVDRGIDTGSVVAQSHFRVTGDDNFVTYPYLHTAAGLGELTRAVEAVLAGELRPLDHQPDLPSALRSHPTLGSYLLARLRRGVR